MINSSPENVSLMMRRANRLKHRATPQELKVKTYLESKGIDFMFQKGFCSEKRFFIVDFYFPKPRKLCLEIDGGYHKERTDYDMWRDAFLIEKRGLRVVRVTNEWVDKALISDIMALL